MVVTAMAIEMATATFFIFFAFVFQIQALFTKEEKKRMFCLLFFIYLFINPCFFQDILISFNLISFSFPPIHKRKKEKK